MKVYHALAKDRTDYAKSKLQLGNGTIDGMIEKIEIFKEQLKSLDEDLAKLGSRYVSENNLPESSIDEIRTINKYFIEEFAQELGN